MSGFPRKTLEPAAVRRKPSVSGLSSGCQQMAGLYDLEETLGKGHFAVVKAAKHVFTGEKVAVKVIDKSKLDAAHQKSLLKEVLCMKLVQHPHVVRLYEVIDTSTKLYLVLELGHGDLYDLIQRQQGGLPEDLARKYFCQILSAVSFCHKLHVVHRDLKPENVVFFPNLDGGQVKLTDFGFSNNYSPGVKLATSCGSLAYSAPEILLGDPYDPAAIDIWSLGVILYMLVAGRAPFQEANDSETLTMIMDVKYSIPPQVTSLSCRELIRSMLVRGPENRAPLDQIERNKWIQEGNYKTLTSQKTPLIVDHRLTPEEQAMIIGQMEAGHIATREQIREALELSAYNHITSTFYLLAEKHLRERKTFPGTPSALTSSLESLHERRKSSGGGHSHSGTSDTDDGLPSETEDSLAPLDLEMKNASPSTSLAVKKAGRIHTALSSSALSDLEKGLQLPVLEENEDSIGSREEDDNAGPLPPSSLPSSTSHHRRRAPYHHRRVIIPQRSASCSSSEDEDSEKKKQRANRNKIKVKHVSECVTKKIFDDESSDEQGNGTGAGSLGLGTSLAGGGQSSSTAGGSGNHPEITYTPSHGSSGPCESFITITPADDDYGVGGEDCDGDGVPESTNHLRLSKSYKNGYTSDPDRHSCSDLAYAIEVNEDSDPRPREHPPTALSLAKKGKKFFFSWFFLKKKTKGSRAEAEANSPSTSVGIYKTKSFAELKLRSSSASVGSKNPTSMDVNMNL